MPKVNPAILEWARKTAGLSTDEAARKLGVSEGRLVAVEGGKRDPTRAMLVKAAEGYHRPLLAFYLPIPPAMSDKGQDFRTLHQLPSPGAEALLAALLRDVQARQGLVKAALDEAEEDEPLPFVGSAKITDGVEAVVSAMRRTLGVSLDGFRQERTIADAFKLLREAAEGSGVFVLLMGNLGTHHTDIEPRVFRGFALADPVAPFAEVRDRRVCGPAKAQPENGRYNLLRSDMIAAGRYRQLCDLFDAERLTIGRTDGEGRADDYVVRRHRVGRGLVDLVRRLLAGGELSTTEAGRVLGVKATNVSRLLQHGRAGYEAVDCRICSTPMC
jgi:transcriptional regulator with XRE-family HTH domain